MADQLYKKCKVLPDEKKTNGPSKTKDDGNLSDDELFPNQAPAKLEGDAMIKETREEDSETQSIKVEGSQVVRNHDIIEIEDSDAVEEDDDDKWAKQGMSEDTTMVVVDRITSSITFTEFPLPTTLTSVTSTMPTAKTKRTRLHSLPTAPAKPPRAIKSQQLTDNQLFQSRANTQRSWLRVKISPREAIHEMTINNEHQ